MFRILPHPIVNNYGGLLQAFALQQVLSKIGVKNQVINYFSRKWGIQQASENFRSKCRGIINLFKIILLARPIALPGMFSPLIFGAVKRRFMRMWNLDLRRTELDGTKKSNIAYIVGSDQVWRCIYARNIESVPFFFLNFATQEQRQRSIAYAASFGSDEWEGTPEETAECARLLRDFKVVSVREHSGVNICREAFGIEAVQMPDPTLLLEQEDYNRLIRNWRTKSTKTPFMAVYLLDETAEKTELVQALSQCTGLYPQHLMPHPGANKLMDRLPLSVPQWLRFIRDSECVLTDSFHGCVFSIIFNKPFICLGNKSRGSARFDSLLGTFGLQERLVTNPSPEKLQQIMRTPINWASVNNIRRSEQSRAFEFLTHNLTKE